MATTFFYNPFGDDEGPVAVAGPDIQRWSQPIRLDVGESSIPGSALADRVSHAAARRMMQDAETAFASGLTPSTATFVSGKPRSFAPTVVEGPDVYTPVTPAPDIARRMMDTAESEFVERNYPPPWYPYVPVPANHPKKFGLSGRNWLIEGVGTEPGQLTPEAYRLLQQRIQVHPTGGELRSRATGGGGGDFLDPRQGGANHGAGDFLPLRRHPNPNTDPHIDREAWRIGREVLSPSTGYFLKFGSGGSEGEYLDIDIGDGFIQRMMKVDWDPDIERLRGATPGRTIVSAGQLLGVATDLRKNPKFRGVPDHGHDQLMWRHPYADPRSEYVLINPAPFFREVPLPRPKSTFP